MMPNSYFTWFFNYMMLYNNELLMHISYVMLNNKKYVMHSIMNESEATNLRTTADNR